MATPRKAAGKRQETPSTGGKTGRASLSLDRVLTGRIKKHDSPKPSEADSSLLEEGTSRLDEAEKELEADRYEEMMEEKKLFPNSHMWAGGEERLFQLLFMRQYSPLMPVHWHVDFRGIPVPGILFATSEVDRPVVYSHLEQDFRATKAIIRLIDLTAMARAFVQTNMKEKIPRYMKKEIDRYVRWAATDGGYQYPHPLPNLVVEVIHQGAGGSGIQNIQNYVESRMKELAERHWDFWGKDKQSPRTGGNAWVEIPPVLYGLFIVNTTLLVVTVDPAKGPKAFVSFQVEVNFNKQNQGVWNAITVAVVVCLARDDMVTRQKYFEK